jgi:DNA-binding transcriptional regulator GbsR (MarR family)
MRDIKQEFIQDFGEAYQRFGLPKLMGRIIGLLIISDTPQSLDEITEELNVSKGPVSQIMQRLRDHRLVQRVWKPGDRKDFYEAVPDIFGAAFKNQISRMKQNLLLAEKYETLLEEEKLPEDAQFAKRVGEMKNFYSQMMQSFNAFLNEWTTRE